MPLSYFGIVEMEPPTLKSRRIPLTFSDFVKSLVIIFISITITLVSNQIGKITGGTGDDLLKFSLPLLGGITGLLLGIVLIVFRKIVLKNH